MKNGEGVKKNVDKAVKYLIEASEDSDAASYKLGELYYNGTHVKRDEEKAREFWRKAAEEDNEDAIECLKIYFGERFGND